MKRILTLILLSIHMVGTAQEATMLATYSKEELHADFDLMVNALKEAHAGLYWYNSIPEFDQIASQERAKLKDSMDSYQFFRIASKIVASTKEGHCRIGSAIDVGYYFNAEASIPPILVKMLDQKLYLLNDIETHNTKGQILVKINNDPISAVIDTVFSYSPKFADGHIKTGKIRYSIDGTGLAYNYTDYFKNHPFYTLEIRDPKTDQPSRIRVSGISSRDFRQLAQQLDQPAFSVPIELDINPQKSIAQLSLHSFRHTYFDKEGNETLAYETFCRQIDSVFSIIREAHIKNLILDVRNNGGGTEGYEDYVFSYLTDSTYEKYSYVQANALSFSFLPHTQHNTAEKRHAFEQAMADEFYQANDGRYLRRKDYMQVAPPKNAPFKGNLYVLISGKTYSGGAEFAGLLKAKTSATFVGEETAGGFYGQTSGFGLRLTLPHTGTQISIPVIKFATNFKSEDIPFGRGVIPDYKVQPTYEEFSSGIDAVLNFVIDHIADRTQENG